MKTAFITGATAGIGLATAKRFAKEGIALVLTGRREERLRKIQSELSDSVPVHILCFDVKDRTACKEQIENIPKSFLPLDILINNAGNAYGLDPVHNADEADWDNMIDINVKGVLNITRLISPSMVERKSGHVINVGSIAGKETYPNGSVYCASKSAVLAFTEAMRKDLNPYGIKVAAINPGLVETEFSEVRFHGNSDKAKQVYKGYQPLTAEDIADTLYFMVSRPTHVNIADVLILPTDQASSTLVNKKRS